MCAGLRLSQPTPIKVVFLLVNVCDAGSPYNVTALEDLLYDDPTGLQRFWGDMSFGRARFNRNTSAIHAVRKGGSTNGGHVRQTSWRKPADTSTAR